MIKALPRQSGFTLVELMMVILIAAILMAVAVPNMRDAIERGSVTSKARELRTTLSEARALALDAPQGAAVVCASADGASCGGNWEEGWLTFLDTNGNGALDAGERIMKVYGGFTDDSVLTVTGGAASVGFAAGTGVLNAVNAIDMVICSPSAKPLYARGVVVPLSGVVRYGRDTNDDGILEDSNGANYVC